MQSPEPLNYDSSPTTRKRRWWLWLLLGLLILSPVALLFLSQGTRGPRPISNRVKCQSNLRQIGQAILLYSNDNAGRFPDSFSTILLNEEITSEVFICPESSDTPATGPTTQAIATQLMTGGHCSYIYLGNGLNAKTVPDNAVVAYEPIANHNNYGGNVLFGDGHVEFMSAKWMVKMLSTLQNRPPASTMPVTMPSDYP